MMSAEYLEGMRAATEGLEIIERSLDQCRRVRDYRPLPPPRPRLVTPPACEIFIDYLPPSERHHVDGVGFLLRLARATTKAGLKRACYREAGVHLIQLRLHRTKADFAELVREECSVSVSRAYELMAVAAGTTTVDRLRSEKAEQQRKHYRRKSRRSPKNTAMKGRKLTDGVVEKIQHFQS